MIVITFDNTLFMGYVRRGMDSVELVCINEQRQNLIINPKKWFVSTISWRCYRKGCRAILQTRMFDVGDLNAVIHVYNISLTSIVVFVNSYFTFNPPAIS